MRGWVKTLLGVLLLLIVLVGVLMLFLLRSGKLEQAQQFAGGMLRVTKGAKDLEHYEKTHPFMIPPEGKIAPERLDSYIEVCATLKPFEAPYVSWMREHMGKKGDFKDAAQAVAFMGEITGTLQKELGARHMSTREFAWTHVAVKEARKELVSRAGSPRAVEILGLLRRTAQDPQLPPHLQKRLSAELDRLGAQGKAELSANALLLESRLDRIREVEPGELADLFLGGVGQGTNPWSTLTDGEGATR